MGELMFDEPHDPTSRDGAPNEENEAECPEADHHAWLRALGNAEDDRGEERKQDDSTEVRDHERFLPVASEWASTAEMMLSSPPTTMNLVP